VRAVLLLLALAAAVFSACIPGEVAGVRCGLDGTLRYRVCVGGAFVARERSCFGEWKACSVEEAACVPAGNCTEDIMLQCPDGRAVMAAKCNMMMYVQQQRILYHGIAQPTGESCGGCAPGYPCEGPAENYAPMAENFSASVSIRELDAVGNPSRYYLYSLRPGENASLRELGVRLLSVNASVRCDREGEPVVEDESALLEVSWGPVKSNLSLREGERSIRYCATYYATPPCADIDLDVMIPVGGIREDAVCAPAPGNAPQPPTTNATQPPEHEVAQPQTNNTPAPQNISQPPAGPPVETAQPASPSHEPPRCLGVFAVAFSLLPLAMRHHLKE